MGRRKPVFNARVASGWTAAVVLFCWFSQPAALLALPAILGDLDDDGRTSARDLVLLVNHLRGTASLASELVPFADLNRDGILNQTDVEVLAQAVVGLREVGGLSLTTIRSTSPASGEDDVSVTRETVLYFSQPLSPSTIVTTDRFYAEFAGRRLLTRAEVASDRRKASLFYLEPLPGGSRVRVTFDGTDLLDAYGRALDADGDGAEGGVFTMDFDTLSLTPIEGTAVVGRVFASELAEGGSPDPSVNVPLEGVTITLDGMEETVRAVTDDMGNFRLEPVPAGEFFVHIDGRTVASYDPTQAYYPFVGKKWKATAGVETSVGNIYLPLVNTGTLQAVSATEDTMVTFPESVLEEYPELDGVAITVPANSLFSDNGARGGRVGIAPVPPDRIPEPLPEGLNFPLVITVQTDGGSNFDRPVPVCFPNLPDPVTGEVLAPGAKSALWSFNHDTGDWEIAGPMTVSADGKHVCTDPGVGILQPGWHGVISGTMVSGGRLVESVIAGLSSEYEPGTAEDPPALASPPCDTCPPESESEPAYSIYGFRGEFHESREDLRVPGPGFDFVWARKYRSGASPRTAQGNGWVFSYHIMVERQGANFVVCDGNTRRDVYTPSASGTWRCPEFFRELQALSDGGYELVFEDRSHWEFHALDGAPEAGKVRAIADDRGNRMRFEYDGLGRLETIRDTLDREYQVGYGAGGMIESVTDFSGRTVRYEYYDGQESGGASGDLKSVITPPVMGGPVGRDFPAGIKTVYTYSSGFADERLNHNLLTITDGRRFDPLDPLFGGGPNVQNLYASTTDPNAPDYDRVIRQIREDGIVDLVYVRQSPSAANGGAVLRTIVNDRRGLITEHFYDARNRLVIVREFTGQADPSQPTTETTNRPENRLRSADPAYFETRREWNDDSLIRRLIQPNGNRTEYVYEADLNPGAPTRARGNLREVRYDAGAHRPAGDQPMRVERFDYDPGPGGGCCGYNAVSREVDAQGNVTQFSYDTAGNLRQAVGPLPDMVEEWEYDSRGRVTAHRYPAADGLPPRVDRFTYDPLTGKVREETVDADNLALKTAFEYDARGNLTRRIDPMGRDTIYEYDALDRLVRRSSPEFRDGTGVRYLQEYGYDAAGNLIREEVHHLTADGEVADNERFTTRYQYDAQNRLTRQEQEVDPDTFVATEYEYDPAGNRVLTRFGEATRGAQPANTLAATYDERNRLFTETRGAGDPSQSTTRYDYDGNGNIVAVHRGVEGAPAITRYTYDGFDRPVRVVDPMGNERRTDYDANHNPIRVTQYGELLDQPGATGNVRLRELQHAYDSANRLVRRTELLFDPATQAMIQPGTSVTQYRYDGASRLISTTDPRGLQTRFQYDSAHRRVGVTDAGGNEVRIAYDPNSNIVRLDRIDQSTSGAEDRFETTLYAYDPLNRVTRIVDGAGNVRDYGYDSRGYLAYVSDGRRASPNAPGNVRRMSYDGLGRLVETMQELTADGTGAGAVTGAIRLRKEYDASSRLRAEIDPTGHRTEYSYDALGRRLETTFADGTTETRSYDPRDNVIELRDPNGTRLSTEYDLLDRPVRTELLPGPGVADETSFEQFGYRGDSLCIQAEDDDSLVARRYDSRGLLLGEVLNGTQIDFAYDARGNLIRTRYPGGRQVACAYDALNRPQEVTDAQGLIVRSEYLGPNRLEQQIMGNGTRATFDYDGRGRITRVRHDRNGTPFDDRFHLWDQENRRQQELQVLPEMRERWFGYDSAGRLIGSIADDVNGSAATLYDLDEAGNRRRVTGGALPGVYERSGATPEPADETMHQYTRTPWDARTYDANGNLIATRESALGEADFHYDHRNQLVGYLDGATGVATAYRYDAFGRRIAKTVGTMPAQTTRYFYGDRQVLEEQDGAGQTLATYVYGRFLDEPIQRQTPAGEQFYHLDPQFSVLGLTDAQGQLIERYRYDAFGSFDVYAPDGQLRDASAVANPFYFTGSRFDPENGTYFKRARNYGPAEGRFLQRDPKGSWHDPRSLGNPFTYAGNDPATLMDPLGLTSIDFDQWWKWSDWQRQMVRNYLELVRLRIDRYLIPALATELAQQFGEFCNDPTANRMKWILRVQELLARMARLSADLAGNSKQFEFELQDLGDEVAARAMFYPWGTASGTIQLNTKTGSAINFFDVTQEEAIATLFHELTHLYGLEDPPEARHDLENSHTIESFFKQLARNPSSSNFLSNKRSLCIRRGI